MPRLPSYSGLQGSEFFMPTCRHMLLSAMVALVPCQAAQTADAARPSLTFSYDILSTSGDKIGSYVSSVKGPGGPTGVTYNLSGQFELSFKVFQLFSYSYSSLDSVSYDNNGIEKFWIIEIDKGKRTTVTGSRSMDKAQLQITETQDREGAEAVSSIVLNSSYDYSLFAFRFPSPCSSHPIGRTRDVKILTPRTGKVSMLRSESVAVDDNYATSHGSAKCRLITRDNSNKVVKESYFSGEGILVFEKTPDYQMRLTGMTHESSK